MFEIICYICRTVCILGGFGGGSHGLAQGSLQGPWLGPRVTTNSSDRSLLCCDETFLFPDDGGLL